MVTNVTSLTGNGLKDWLIQRVSALYLAVYMLIFVGHLLSSMPISYEAWSTWFHTTWVEIATVIALFMLLLHAWIGIWTVTTDYLKCTAMRVSLQVLVALFLSGQFLWGLMMVWGQ